MSDAAHKLAEGEIQWLKGVFEEMDSPTEQSGYQRVGVLGLRVLDTLERQQAALEEARMHMDAGAWAQVNHILEETK